MKPLPGDCCVFCSYGSVPCPPVQVARRAEDGKGCCGSLSAQASDDWVGNARTSLLAWWLPHTLVVAGLFAGVPAREPEPNRQSDRRDRLAGRAHTAADRLRDHAEKRSPLGRLARVHSHVPRDHRHSEPRDPAHNDADWSSHWCLPVEVSGLVDNSAARSGQDNRRKEPHEWFHSPADRNTHQELPLAGSDLADSHSRRGSDRSDRWVTLRVGDLAQDRIGRGNHHSDYWARSSRAGAFPRTAPGRGKDRRVHSATRQPDMAELGRKAPAIH